jgi:hypothetical protein
VLDRLVLPDQLAEGAALLRILARDVVGGLRDPERLRCDPDPAAVERRHRNVEALALVVQQPVPTHLDALDDDVVRHRRVEAELLLLPRDPDVVGVEHERRHALRARRRLIATGEEQERRGVCPVRDPLLRAGDRPAAVRRLRLRTKRPGVRSGFGLGEREGPDPLAARERRDEAGALLVGAEGEDRQRAGARVDGDRDPHPGVGARELLEDEDVGEEVRSGAAVLLRDADTHQPELGELRVQVAREAVLAVPLGCVGSDLGVRELACQRTDLPLRAGELEVH